LAFQRLASPLYCIPWPQYRHLQRWLWDAVCSLLLHLEREYTLESTLKYYNPASLGMMALSRMAQL
jgi:hypothetical protein